tara:strand:- start:468 stop:830 length:363 start_codon:yes stop_codon:yes gene_type:complete
MAKNNVATQGYFVRRLRKYGYEISRVYDRYSKDDKRKWTVVVNPGLDSIFITCIDKGEWPYRGMYLFDDNGTIFPSSFYINTDSMEVILKYLDHYKIDKLFPGKVLNNSDGKKEKATGSE